MSKPETTMGGAFAGWQPTGWTLILNAKDPTAPDRREALDRLVRTYWKPVYFYVRRRGHAVEAAKDLTQAFFTVFLEKEFLEAVRPDRGRFRSFLLAAVRHFLSNDYDRRQAIKRGGIVDFVPAEDELQGADPSPEQAFEDQWALEVMARANARLQAESGDEEYALLSSQDGPLTSDQKNRRRRLRLRLREILLEEILPSVADPAEAEAELRDLYSMRIR